MRSFVFATLQLFAFSLCHSWIEQVRLISAQNGEYIGQPGYMRGYVPRGPLFKDALNENLLPPVSSGRTIIDGTDRVCKPSQEKPNYVATFPRLVASPGDYIALRYLENGHVTLPEIQIGKPGSSGTVLVYATTQPGINQTISEVLSWGVDQSGDNSGRLLTVQNFDDGRCYQMNGSPKQIDRARKFPNVPADAAAGAPNEELWCETNVRIPQDIRSDITVYWLWEWSTLPARDPFLPDGKVESYTSCLDIAITDQVRAADLRSNASSRFPAQDPQLHAVPNFKQRAANLTIPEGLPDLWV